MRFFIPIAKILDVRIDIIPAMKILTYIIALIFKNSWRRDENSEMEKPKKSGSGEERSFFNEWYGGERRRREERRERGSCLRLLRFSQLYNVEKRSTGRPRESIVFSTHSDRYRVPLLSRANLDIRVYMYTYIHSYIRAMRSYTYSERAHCTCIHRERCTFLYIRYKYAGYRCTTLHDLVNTLNEWFSRWMARHHGAAWSHTNVIHWERSRSKISETSWRAIRFDT